MTTNIEKQILQLREEIERHNHNYYLNNSPSISDFEFDMKLKQLELMESAYPQFADKNSPTQRVGNDITKSFKQIEHQYPMLSLANTYSQKEVADFYNRVAKTLDSDFEIVCELKFDGASISLIYENGELTAAVTRGDGVMGDDVTANVKTISSVPLKLHGDFPAKFEIRGEVLMPFKVFEQLNNQREQNGEQQFANPRNAASGALKLQASSDVKKRKLDSYLYYILGEDLPCSTHYNNILKAKQWGFKISEHIKCCKTLSEVFEFIDYWDSRRFQLPVATDGIVLKINDIHQQQMLGLTAKSPRWAIAYKYKAESSSTILYSVSYQVGRTGAVTPVANLNPVALSGTTVRRASLHNADFIESLGLHLGDMVYVEKGGEIIPKVTGVDVDSRQSLSQPVVFVEFCPECGTKLVRNEEEAVFYCPNEEACPPQIKGKITHFASRKAMNIEGLGEETVNLLYNNGLVKNVADVYELKITDLSELEGFGQKSAQNLIEGIAKSKQVSFERVLFALGIRYVGQTVAKRITAALSTIDKIREASFDRLVQIDEVGEVIAKSVINYFSKEENKLLIDRLILCGLNFESNKIAIAENGKLKGKIIVISGVFAHHSRDEYKSMIEQNGGTNAGSISSKTSFVLAGEKMGQSKLEKAQSLEIEIVSENDFLLMLE